MQHDFVSSGSSLCWNYCAIEVSGATFWGWLRKYCLMPSIGLMIRRLTKWTDLLYKRNHLNVKCQSHFVSDRLKLIFALIAIVMSCLLLVFTDTFVWTDDQTNTAVELFPDGKRSWWPMAKYVILVDDVTRGKAFDIHTVCSKRLYILCIISSEYMYGWGLRFLTIYSSVLYCSAIGDSGNFHVHAHMLRQTHCGVNNKT